MGRFRKTKKSRNGSSAPGIRDFVVSKAMTLAVIGFFIFFAVMLVRAFLNESGYFKLRSVDLKSSFLSPQASSYISDYVLKANSGRNVFNIDLKYIARFIQNSYGDVKDVVVSIAPPDRLVINLKMRRPVALVKGARFYPVDEDGVVLPAGSRVDALNDMPIIIGVNIGAGSSHAATKNLRRALDLLREIGQVRQLTNIGVISISVNDPNNLIFYLKGGVEVRIGSERFKDRLELLARTLRDPRLVMDNIKYIDVRFKDVIIGPKLS
ncbi:MAG: cell division protein FtsQ/DivIB [Candidatus Omnitrophica bacterium]|nr:cell division protein FtsQ/DivIB [Candidatus Omnitrophota bacterium]